jgi:hypothetical protein
MSNTVEQAGATDLEHLLRLCDPQLDPLFWPSSRPSALSAWHGHVPFAHWLVTAARPSTVVELGTHAGTSYSAFCEAVLRSTLPARCFAIDTWEGDEHSGHYGEEIFNDLKRFNDGRYGRFSTLIRAPFDAAAETFPAASIDLLHIDGLHTYEAVKHDFETWLPKLSPRAVVLLHDTAVHMAGFGVAKLWAELQTLHPAFSFSHCYGLGVLAVGAQVAASVAALCRLGEPEAQRVRARFERIGEAHELRVALLTMARRAQQNPPISAP